MTTEVPGHPADDRKPVTPESRREPEEEKGEKEEAASIRRSNLFSSMVLVPLAIAVVCVMIVLVVRLLTTETKRVTDYVGEVRTGSATRRWQSAYELSLLLSRKGGPPLTDLEAAEIGRAFEEARSGDPRVRRYLALALGRAGRKTTIPTLVGALGDPDPDTRLYSIWALGAIDDPEAVPALLPLLEDGDAAVRKMSAYALGAIGDRTAIERLRPLLGDEEDDVRWNAALSLATLGDSSGERVLLAMTDPGYMAGIEGLTEEQRVDATLNAVRALRKVGTPAARKRLEELRADPNAKIQNEAILAVKEMER